jgi:hypothetical protein
MYIPIPLFFKKYCTPYRYPLHPHLGNLTYDPHVEDEDLVLFFGYIEDQFDRFFNFLNHFAMSSWILIPLHSMDPAPLK